MSGFKDLTGQAFGRWTVIGGPNGKNQSGNYLWDCKCSCGNPNIIKVASGYLRNGTSTSCGCLRKENSKKSCSTINGLSKDPLYNYYRGMINRVMNDGNIGNTVNYQNRGITVDESFLLPDGIGFINFKNEIGVYPTDGKKYTVDRIDNNKNYEPGNIRWATYTTQNRNSRNNVIRDMNHANHIRLLWLSGKYSQSQITAAENITQSLVSQIINYKIWA